MNAYFKFISFKFLILILLISPNLMAASMCKDFLSSQQKTSTNSVVLYEHPQDLLNEMQFNPWAKSYIELAAKKLLKSQTDVSLATRNLLVEDGGLCGPACFANAYIAKDRAISKTPSDYWLNNFHSIVELVLKEYHKIQMSLFGTFHDARKGTIVSMYFGKNSPLLKQTGFKSEVIDIKSTNHMIYKLSRQNSIVFSSVAFVNIKDNIQHAIVILGADPANKKLILADPNSPNEILSTSYHLTKDNKLQFWLWPELYIQSDVKEALVELSTAHLLTY